MQKPLVHVVNPTLRGPRVGEAVVLDSLRRAGFEATYSLKTDGQLNLFDFREIFTAPSHVNQWWISLLTFRDWILLPPLVRELRARYKRSKIVLGGCSAYSLPKSSLEHVDAIVTGDVPNAGAAREVFGRVEAKEHEIDMGFRQPPRHAIVTGKSPTVIEQLGCQHKCPYCKIGGEPVRRLPREVVVEAALATRRKAVSIYSPCGARASTLAALHGRGISTNAVDFRPRTALALLRRGLISLCSIGVEGASERLRASIGRPLPDQIIVDIARLASPRLYLIAGLPGETDEDLRELFRLVMQIRSLRSFRITATPLFPVQGAKMQSQPGPEVWQRWGDFRAEVRQAWLNDGRRVAFNNMLGRERYLREVKISKEGPAW